MKKVLVNSNYSILNKNGNIFNRVGDKSISRFLDQMKSLEQSGLEHGISFQTIHSLSIHEADGFFLIDMPKDNDPMLKRIKKINKPKFLYTWESPLINERNHNTEALEIFDLVFTFNEDLVDEKKFLKVNYSFDFPEVSSIQTKNRKLLCSISSNRYSYDQGELYTERRNLIKKCEDKLSKDFDLYGKGWTKKIPPKNIFEKVFNKFEFIHSSYPSEFTSYRGEVRSKDFILKKYRFSICYENFEGEKGYISEKIFDSFFALNVPIYLGEKNIENFIPQKCFIDRKKFSSDEDIINFIKEMGNFEYETFIKNIRNFILEQKGGNFSNQGFCKKIISNILEKI